MHIGNIVLIIVIIAIITIELSENLEANDTQ